MKILIRLKAERKQKHHKENKEKHNEQMKEWYEVNKASIALKQKEIRLKIKHQQQQQIEQAIEDLHIAVERVPE